MTSPEYFPPPLPPIPTNRWKYVLSRVGAFFGGIILIAAIGAFWTQGNPVFVGPTVALSLMLVVMLAMHLRRARMRRARLVLQHLASGISVRMPLPEYLRAAAASETSPVQARLRKIAKHLESGVPIGTAFHLATGELDLRVPGQLDVAQASGYLDRAIARLTASHDDEPLMARQAGSLPYVLAVSMALYGAFLLVAIFVMPKFNAIFRDFGVEIPWLTGQFVNALPELLPIVAIALVVTLLIVVTRNTRMLFSSRVQRSWYRGLSDRLAWYTPVIGRLTRDQNYADLAAAIAGAAGTGHTLDYALSMMPRAELNGVLRSRATRMRQLMFGGADAASAARDAGLPLLMVSLFKTESSPDLARAMQFAHNAYSARHSRLLVVIQAILPVLITLLFAVFTVITVLALFLPMVRLIDAVAGQWGGTSL